MRLFKRRKWKAVATNRLTEHSAEDHDVIVNVATLVLYRSDDGKTKVERREGKWDLRAFQ